MSEISITTLATLMGLAAVAGTAGSEILRLALRRFWKKTVETEYVTVEACTKMRSECKHGDRKEVTEAINRFAAELQALRRITVRHVLTNSDLGPEDRKALESLLSA